MVLTVDFRLAAPGHSSGPVRRCLTTTLSRGQASLHGTNAHESDASQVARSVAHLDGQAIAVNFRCIMTATMAAIATNTNSRLSTATSFLAGKTEGTKRFQKPACLDTLSVVPQEQRSPRESARNRPSSSGFLRPPTPRHHFCVFPKPNCLGTLPVVPSNGERRCRRSSAGGT